MFQGEEHVFRLDEVVIDSDQSKFYVEFTKHSVTATEAQELLKTAVQFLTHILQDHEIKLVTMYATEGFTTYFRIVSPNTVMSRTAKQSIIAMSKGKEFEFTTASHSRGDTHL